MRVPSGNGRSFFVILTVVLFGVVTAQCVPIQTKTQPERFWLASRYDKNRIIVYFDAVKFNGTLPHDAQSLADPGAGGFFAPVKLSASYIAQFQKSPDAEHFALGDKYDLLMDEGHIATVTLTTLVGAESDEEVGNNSFIGALATLENDDLIFFSKNLYAVRRHHNRPDVESKPKFDPEAVHAGIQGEPVRFDIQTQIVALLNQLMKKAVKNLSPVFEVQAFCVANGTLRYYARAEWKWRSEKELHEIYHSSVYALGAWIAPSPTLHILAVQERTTEYDDFGSILPTLINVVDLGGGRTGLIVSSSRNDSNSLDLVEYRDGANLSNMRSLQSIGVGE